MPQLPGQGCSFHSFRTNTYKLSFMESPSGIKVRIFPPSIMYLLDINLLFSDAGFLLMAHNELQVKDPSK